MKSNYQFLVFCLLFLTTCHAMQVPYRPNPSKDIKEEALDVSTLLKTIHQKVKTVITTLEEQIFEATSAKKALIKSQLKELISLVQKLPLNHELNKPLREFSLSVESLIHDPFNQKLLRSFTNITQPLLVNLKSIEISKANKISEPQIRKTPPISAFDTVIFSPSGVKSVHRGAKFFNDNEIIEKLDIIKKVEIGPDIYALYTKNGKAIIQQQAMRGCTAAAAAMLIMDKGKKPDFRCLRNRNLGNDEDNVRDIQDAGLKAVINSANNLSELRNLIMQNGSAIVGVGGHVIVIDEISKDLSKVRLRDPYHGWEITVTSEALKGWRGSAIQAANA